MNSTFKHVWSVLCQKSLVESDSNILSLMEIIEQTKVTLTEADQELVDQGKNLAVPFNFEIVSLWKKTNIQKKSKEYVRVILYSPKNKKLGEGTVTLQASTEKKAMRTIIRFSKLPLRGNGEYRIDVLLKKGKNYTVMAEIFFDVEIITKKTTK